MEVAMMSSFEVDKGMDVVYNLQSILFLGQPSAEN
jgi:hypothetical protein